MAPPAGTLRVGRYFLALLGIFAVLYAVVVWPGQRHKPKLGIDLVGGVRVVFTAVTPKGAPQPTSSQMTQARQIIEDRVNTYGVTGATVVVQGGNQLVVEIPNGTGADVAALGSAAVLNFRGIIAPVQPVTCRPTATPSGAPSVSTSPSGTGSPSGSATGSASTTPTSTGTAAKSPHDAAARPLTAPTSSSKPKPTASSTPKASGTPKATPSPSASGSSTTPAAPRCSADPISALLAIDKSLKGKIPNAEECPSPGISDSQCRAYSSLTSAQQSELAGALQSFDCNSAQAEPDKANRYYIACDETHTYAYLMGHIVVHGREIGSAAAQAPDISGNGGPTEWTVRLTLKGSGADSWHAWTSKYHTDNQSVSPIQTSATPPCGVSAGLKCSNFVAFTLDGNVISSPVTLAVLDRQTSISGGFTQSTANDLARQLNYGKLPITFRAEENNKVSATLGNKQLHAAFVAGGIGLILVVIYSLLYYRALGFVTIASLIVSGGLTYAMLVILSTQIGFTLDLAGIAGFIVALGITADSFVVFFERIKDEVHEGRSVRVAVPRAWVRARRTILSADTVSFLAAAILYYFAAANVKGFAFTLGMSTILDLVVVFLFTHPMVSVLSRIKSFGSARLTGLGSVRAGGIATTDDEPLPTRRRPARTRRAAAGAESGGGGVAVLDEETETDEVAAGDETETEADSDEPRRRTTPQPGSAAERAAARRARMRGESGGEEKS